MPVEKKCRCRTDKSMPPEVIIGVAKKGAKQESACDESADSQEELKC